MSRPSFYHLVPVGWDGLQQVEKNLSSKAEELRKAVVRDLGCCEDASCDDCRADRARGERLTAQAAGLRDLCRACERIDGLGFELLVRFVSNTSPDRAELMLLADLPGAIKS